MLRKWNQFESMTSMDERSHPLNGQPIPLGIAAGNRLVMPGGEPVLGWIGSESGQTAGPLAFPTKLLEAQALSTVFYAANLPRPTGKAEAGGSRVKAVRKISAAQESAFLAASLPGGQINAPSPNNCKGILRFRWLMLDPLSWRCLVSRRDKSLREAWMPLPHIYTFDSLGCLESHPAPQIFSACGQELQIVHPEGMLTCLPCTSGLVKIRNLQTDGRESRELRGLELLPNRMIEARFSDGKTALFATAAPVQAAPALAA